MSEMLYRTHDANIITWLMSQDYPIEKIEKINNQLYITFKDDGTISESIKKFINGGEVSAQKLLNARDNLKRILHHYR